MSDIVERIIRHASALRQIGVATNTDILLDEVAREIACLRGTVYKLRNTPDAYAVHNDQGYWVGIYNDKALAEHVRDKQPPSGKEKVVPVKILTDY